MNDSPFKKLSEETVFSGHIFSVVTTAWISKDEESFQRSVVRHPGAVAIVPLNATNQVLFVRQFRAPIGKTLLEIPAGTCDVEGEDKKNTARRELIEEVGHDAKSIELLGEIYNSPGISDQITSIYLATTLLEVQSKPSGVEELHMTIEAVDIDTAFSDGNFPMCAISYVGIQLALDRLRHNR